MLLSWAPVNAGILSSVINTSVSGLLQIPSDALPVYRFWSPIAGKHFYTLDEVEKAKLLSQYTRVWTYEGVAFRAFASPAGDGLAPVYRFWSPSSGAHFYTLEEAEKDKLLRSYAGIWTYEGIAFYAYAPGTQPAGTMPVHRFWSGALGTHFYTTSDTERFKLVSSYTGTWDYEGAAWDAYPAEAATAVAITKGPYIQETGPDSVTILWQTDAAAESVVQYGIGTPEASTVADSSATTLHRATLSGLAPGVIYVYRVTSGPASQTGTFRTAPATDQPFRFAVYGDTRTNTQVHRQVAAAMAASGPDLVFHTGDLVGAGRDYRLWNTEFFEPAGGLMLTAPVVPVLGNHEYGGAGPLWFFYFFDRPVHEGWFALTCGNVRFLGLNTNVDYSPDSAQYEWFVQELQSAAYRSATWHIVLFHHPPFTSTTGHPEDATVQRQLVPLFEQYGVNAVFSGHNHIYERYFYHGIHYIVTGGGGAPLYALTADSVPPVRQFGRSAYHYCIVDVDPSAGTLTIAATDLGGQVFDAVVLSK
ncbi:MAG: metallophosphoesterase [Planctomycetes bacterium]|nr:metallophosphoesterase [Planctomycetota bacterium]